MTETPKEEEENKSRSIHHGGNDDGPMKKKNPSDDDDDAEVSELTEDLSSIQLLSVVNKTSNILICDAGYGFPREARPRKEKILATARQLVNFLEWQLQNTNEKEKKLAQVRVVGCNDEATKSVLENRTKELLMGTTTSSLPPHVEFSCEPLEEACCRRDSSSSSEVVYLSPDAEESLDPAQVPPSIVVVGLLIDRRVQPNRSKDRASGLNIVSKRWPLEQCFAEIDPKEPLNVDCVLEGMQQWWWNCEQGQQQQVSKESFVQAAEQAIEHHALRHPSRPIHLPK